MFCGRHLLKTKIKRVFEKKSRRNVLSLKESIIKQEPMQNFAKKLNSFEPPNQTFAINETNGSVGSICSFILDTK